MAEHTPGPWARSGGGFVVVAPPERGTRLTVTDYVRGGTREQQIANASLIAAAPDLLAALKAMVGSYDGLRDALTCKTVIGKLAAADAAISKAEGRDAK